MNDFFNKKSKQLMRKMNITMAWFFVDYGIMGVNLMLGNGAVGMGDMIDSWYGRPIAIW